MKSEHFVKVAVFLKILMTCKIFVMKIAICFYISTHSVSMQIVLRTINICFYDLNQILIRLWPISVLMFMALSL